MSDKKLMRENKKLKTALNHIVDLVADNQDLHKEVRKLYIHAMKDRAFEYSWEYVLYPEEERYSKIPGMGKKQYNEEERAIRAFGLYVAKYLKDATAFAIPDWFIEARTKFTREECRQMFLEECPEAGK